MIFFDFSKAFDKVPHNRLIYKLTKYRFNQQVVNWIKDWLSSRTSAVIAKGQTSRKFETTSGVPQGSVLGPLLFLIYINDIPENIVHSDCRLYADDTLICTNLKETNREGLQQDIDELQKWSNKWQMSFNTSKCRHMQVGQAAANMLIHIDDVPIPQDEVLKYLGITVQNNLKWSNHVANMSKKSM